MQKSRANIVFRCVLAVLCIYCMFVYYTYNQEVKAGIVIEYELIGKRSSAKGGHTLNVYYENKSHHIAVKGGEYDLIDKGQLPDLYYSKLLNHVFSVYETKLVFRLFLLLLVFFIVTFMPFWKRAK